MASHRMVYILTHSFIHISYPCNQCNHASPSNPLASLPSFFSFPAKHRGMIHEWILNEWTNRILRHWYHSLSDPRWTLPPLDPIIAELWTEKDPAPSALPPSPFPDLTDWLTGLLGTFFCSAPPFLPSISSWPTPHQMVPFLSSAKLRFDHPPLGKNGHHEIFFLFPVRIHPIC